MFRAIVEALLFFLTGWRQGCGQSGLHGNVQLREGREHKVQGCECFVDAVVPGEGADGSQWGHSMVVDPMGRVLGEAGEAGATVVVAIDAAELGRARASIPVTSQRRFDVYRDVAE
jgi:predicted amidohydrolase